MISALLPYSHGSHLLLENWKNSDIHAKKDIHRCRDKICSIHYCISHKHTHCYIQIYHNIKASNPNSYIIGHIIQTGSVFARKT